LAAKTGGPASRMTERGTRRSEAVPLAYQSRNKRGKKTTSPRVCVFSGKRKGKLKKLLPGSSETKAHDISEQKGKGPQKKLPEKRQKKRKKKEGNGKAMQRNRSSGKKKNGRKPIKRKKKVSQKSYKRVTKAY